MKNKEKHFWKYYIPSLLLVCFFVGLLLSYDNETNKEDINDATKFKTEYESLNDQEMSGTDLIYQNISIDNDNLFYYASEDDIRNVLNTTGVIYLGYPSCLWCRNIVNILNDSVKKYDLNRIYYYNIKPIASEFVLDDKENVIKEKDGTTFYYELLEKLSEFLEDRVVVKEDNSIIKTGEKLLESPSIIFVKDGIVLDVLTGSVEEQTNPFIKLNDNQVSALESIYNSYLDEIVK